MEVVGFLSSPLRMNAAKTEPSKGTKVPVTTPDRSPLCLRRDNRALAATRPPRETR